MNTKGTKAIEEHEEGKTVKETLLRALAFRADFFVLFDLFVRFVVKCRA